MRQQNLQNTARHALARMFAILLLAVVCASAPLSVAHAQTSRQVNALLDAWRMKEARQSLESFTQKNGEDSEEALYLRGRYAFFEGNYSEAVALMDRALAKYPENAMWKADRDIIDATREVTRDYEKHTSPDGKFIVYIEPGRDRVLLPYAFEALDAAYDELGKELGHYPETPIRVEVYPTTATLARVSSLTEEEIRTSGTIALCKYNRLMITSPKALLRGYGWVDTLVHEYVHYIINHKTQNRVPIWMHEGMAKYLERRWRGDGANRLAPSYEHLLRKRVDANDLITFAQMHPSMAKLPSQDDAAVAFAEVYTVMEYLRSEVGEGAFAKVLDGINEGLDAQQAFARPLATTFPEFEKKWQAYLKTRPRVDFPEGETGFDEKLRFKDESGDAALTDLKQIPKPAARDHIHLGQMLQARSRHEAAIVQYQKAAALMGDRNPLLQTRLAQCFMAVNRPKDALAALEPVRDTYPSYVVTWLELGRAQIANKQWSAARDNLLEAARINPFDPEVHELLARAYEGLGQKELAERERKLRALVM